MAVDKKHDGDITAPSKRSFAGLYRLCGSETKKKMLRDSFEQDPDSVDLTSENVPDINVITSKF